MKKLIVFVLISSIFIFNNKVYAANSSATLNESGTYDNETLYKDLKSNYDKGLGTFNIKEANTVITLYGKSECDNSGCDYTYADKTTNFKDILAKSVKCTNGEKNINYTQIPQNKVDFKGADGNKLNGTAYWSEDYYITCTTTATGEGIVNLNNDTTNSDSSNTSNSNQSNNNTSNSNQNASNSNQSNSGDYTTSTTTPNPEQGIKTYYLVLGITVVLTYLFMLIVKKYNLFKKI